MSVPAPSATRAQLTLQPSYFTSSLFVHPLREDILRLVRLFHEQYVKTRPSQPFALFQAIWDSQGWKWLHFKVFDARARETFLAVTSRLFLERTVATEMQMSRVVGLFGFYTFFMTQPSPSTHVLYSISHVPIPIDHYISLMTLPNVLTSEQLCPLKPYVVYILSMLVNAQSFHIVPCSELCPMNPRDLPREIFVQDYGTVVDGAKKRGRPSKREKTKKVKEALLSLDKWLEKPSTSKLISNAPTTTLQVYQTQKTKLLEDISPDVLERANTAVLTRLQKIDEMAAEKGLEVGGEGGERTGLERVERAVRTREGILGLLHNQNK